MLDFLNDILKPVQDFIKDNLQAMAIVVIVLALALIILFIVAFVQVGKTKSLKSRLAKVSQNEQALTAKQQEANETVATLNQQLDGLKQHSDALLELNQSLHVEIDQTKSENESLKSENESLKSENETLKSEIETLKNEIETLKQQPKPKTTKKTATKKAEVDTQDTTVVLEEDDETIEVTEKNAAKNEGFILKYDRLKGDWTIKKKGATRATRRADTKEEAVKIAKELSRKYNVSLSIHKKDGKFQKQ